MGALGLALLIGLGAPMAPPPTPAIVSWQLNGVPRGDAVVLTRGDAVWMPPDVLASAGVEASPTARVRWADAPYVDLSRVAGLTAALDQGHAALRIEAEPRLFGATVVDLAPDRPDDSAVRSDPAAYLNYSPRLTDGERLEAYAEAGASVGGWALFSGASHRPEAPAVRGLSHLTWDDAPRMVRWRLGDDFQGAGALGSQTLLGGLTVGREYSLDPYHRGAPGLGLSGAVATPATVDVYVNDALVRSERVPAGGFTLANLPVSTGAGVVRYEIRDAVGQQQVFDAVYYLAPGLLARGEHDFRYSVGVPRLDFDTDSARYAGREPAAVARHRVGLTDAVTLGGGVEASVHGISGGPSLSLGLPVGGLQLAAAGSQMHGEGGLAGLVGYGYRGRVVGGSLSVQATSRRFGNLGLTPDDDRRLVEAAGQLSVTLGVGAATIQQRVAQQRDRGLALDSVLHLGRQILPGLSLRLTGARSHPAPELPVVYSAYASLGGTFDFGLSGRLGSRADDAGQRQVDVGLARALPRRQGVGFDAQATLEAQAATQASVTGRAHAPPGRVLARYLHGPTGDHTVLEVNGGLAWVRGGGLHLTQPVQQAFGVVQVPELPGVEVRLDNNPVATTDGDGRAFLPHLRPYQANRISVNARALPMDRRIDRAEHRVAPPWRGGALVVMAITRALFVRGRLLLRGPDPDRVPRYGRLTLRRGVEAVGSPVGEDGAFEFGELAPGRYPGILRAGDGSRCMLTLTVPDQGGPVVDVGTVECVEVPGARPRALAQRGAR